MSGSAWFWLLVVILVLWVVPIALFLYQPKRDPVGQEEWQGVPYEHLKFGKRKEILSIASVCVLTSWVIWFCVKAGLLAWK
ncbi:hypothetical protein [Desulfosporosinus youngiae]|uniref:hypothetical protein n=1 Tax=Desulfosporosinus youngiae TaxID=339862 RepID=UPI00030D030D|nr:hypothetical protein [Desulfosporosinus youngiae]